MNKDKIHIYYDNELHIDYISSDGTIVPTPIGWQEKIKSLSKDEKVIVEYIENKIYCKYDDLDVEIDSWLTVVKNDPVIHDYVKQIMTFKMQQRVKTLTSKKLKTRKLQNNIRKKTNELDLDYEPLVGSIDVEPTIKDNASTSKKDIPIVLKPKLNVTSNVVVPKVVTRKNKYHSGKIVTGMVILYILAGVANHLFWIYENKINTTDIHNLVIEQTLTSSEPLPTIPSLESLEVDTITDDSSAYLFYEDRSKDMKAIQTKNKYGSLIEKNARKCGIDPRIVFGIATQESGDHEYGLRNGNAGGLMQIEMSNWRDEEITYYDFDDEKYYTIKITQDNIQDVDNNILIGCAILQNELKMYNYNILLAIQSYNFGYSNMSKVLNATSAKTGLTKMQIINNHNCYDWLNFVDIVNAGDANYLNHVLSYTGFGYDVYDFYCKTPDATLKTCTTLPISSISQHQSKSLGFTLIELLAVIIVLVIVSLIGYTTVGHIIESSKISSTARNIENFEEALQQNCLMITKDIKNQSVTKEYIYEQTVADYEGTVPINSADSIYYVEDGTCDIGITNPINIDKLTCSKSSDVSWKCSETSICSVTSGNGETYGDEITCGTEKFYVLSTNDTTITMLAKYNLNVGSAKDTSKTLGIQASGGTYWTTGSPATNTYINDYLEYLKETIGMHADTTISLPTASSLNCEYWSNGYGDCTSTSSWVYSVPYWIGFSNCGSDWCNQSAVMLSGDIRYEYNKKTNSYGVRPMVTMLKSDLSE